LKKARLVKSFKGVKGGYQLARPAGKINVAEIILALEGELYQSHCAGCDHCACRLNPVWKQLTLAVERALRPIKLSSLLK
jgi:Rrf2 family protein